MSFSPMWLTLLQKRWLGCLLAIFAFSVLIPEDVDARRRGVSRSRRSSSYGRSKPRSSRRSTRSRRKKGMNFGSIFSSSKKAKSSKSRSRSAVRSSSRSRSRSRRSRPRYKNRGSWWSQTSSLKRTWRKSFRPRRRFRRNFFSRHRPIVDIWDPYFLASAATTLFWYHHWHDPEIQEALYEDHVLEDAELLSLENEIKRLEAQGIVRDSEYLPEGIAPQDAYSDAYIRRERRRHNEGGSGLIILVSIIVGLGIGSKLLNRS